jgi:hypothetical protein
LIACLRYGGNGAFHCVKDKPSPKPSQECQHFRGTMGGLVRRPHCRWCCCCG